MNQFITVKCALAALFILLSPSITAQIEDQGFSQQQRFIQPSQGYNIYGNTSFNSSMPQSSFNLQNPYDQTGPMGGGYQGYTPLEHPINPDEYFLGVGDVLLLKVWGKTIIENNLTVNAEGKLPLPKGGILKAAGKSISTLDSEVQHILKDYYIGSNISISLLEPRQFIISVVGEVNNPGVYPAAATDRISKILQLAGGISSKGSFNFIEIKRKKKHQQVNLEKYLRFGEIEENPFVQEADIVFVPLKKNSITISGEIRKAQSYEIGDKTTIASIITRAGGLTSDASYILDSKLTRTFKGKREKETTWFNLKDVIDGKNDLILRDGDSIAITSSTPFQNTVVLKGAIILSGNANNLINNKAAKGAEIEAFFPLYKGETIRSLIEKSGGVSPYARLAEATLTRVNYETNEETILNVNLYKLLIQQDIRFDMKLLPGDILYIPSKNHLVHISGEVKSPQSIPFQAHLSSIEYINMAGGQTNRASFWRAKLIKPNGSQIDLSNNPEIEAGDTIYIPEVVAKFWQDYLFIATSITSLTFAIMAATR